MRIETRQWLPMTHCVGYLLTHWFGSRTRTFVGSILTTAARTHLVMWVYCTHTHTDVRLCEKEWQREAK